MSFFRFTFFVVIAHLLFVACTSDKNIANEPLHITKAFIAKDNNGKMGDETQNIAADNQTFHCGVNLNKKQAGSKVKITLIAVNAEGYENFEVRTLDQPTDSLNTTLDFPFSLARPWFKGSYRCDVYLNEELKQAVNFSIQ